MFPTKIVENSKKPNSYKCLFDSAQPCRIIFLHKDVSTVEAPQPDSETEKKAPAPAKEPPKAKPVPDTSVIDMTEAEVKKKFGEPDIVSKMPDNRIIWTYQPTWKIMPDNKGTVYIEFENGKVIKIIRAR